MASYATRLLDGRVQGVDVERPCEQARPVETGRGRDERARPEAVPVLNAEG